MIYLKGNQYVCAYGTLMSYNDESLLVRTNSQKIKEVNINGFQIYIAMANFLYPVLKKGASEVPLFAEIWEVSDSTLKKLDLYENIDSGLYKRELINVDGFECYIYEYNHLIKKNMIILHSNNWKNFIKENEEAITIFNFYSSEWYDMNNEGVSESFLYNINTGIKEIMHITEIEDIIDIYEEKIKNNA